MSDDSLALYPDWRMFLAAGLLANVGTYKGGVGHWRRTKGFGNHRWTHFSIFREQMRRFEFLFSDVVMTKHFNWDINLVSFTSWAVHWLEKMNWHMYCIYWIYLLKIMNIYLFTNYLDVQTNVLTFFFWESKYQKAEFWLLCAALCQRCPHCECCKLFVAGVSPQQKWSLLSLTCCKWQQCFSSIQFLYSSDNKKKNICLFQVRKGSLRCVMDSRWPKTKAHKQSLYHLGEKYLSY